ncbi:MAG: alpha-ketoglutarate decarboxylase [Robiginitalea sp.]|nr:alpha-ketoglutarate decarboxylase [Robiginitalea sp.]
MSLFLPKFLPGSHRWLFFLIFCFVCSASTAQSDSFWSRVRYGGGIGLSFGQEFVQIGLAPSAIYQVNDYAAVGLGINYSYSKISDTKFSAIGGSLIGLVNPIPALQVSGEFEQLYVNQSFGPLDDSYWLPALFLGLGYATGPVTFGIRYDVLYDSDKSLYADPWIPFVRVYF